MQLIHDDEMDRQINVSAKDCEVACQGREAPDSERATARSAIEPAETSEFPLCRGTGNAQGEHDAPSGLPGWEIKRGCEGQIIVRQIAPDYVGYVASRDSDNIASSVLYELANALLATPAPTAGEPSARTDGEYPK